MTSRRTRAVAEPEAAPAGRLEAPVQTAEGVLEQKGGVILLGGKVIGHTREGALESTAGGVKDPSRLPDEPALGGSAASLPAASAPSAMPGAETDPAAADAEA